MTEYNPNTQYVVTVNDPVTTRLVSQEETL